MATITLLKREPEEKTLVTAAQMGCREDFDRLIARYRPQFQRYVLRRVPAHEAEDILQDCTIALWKGLPRLESAGTFRAWAWVIVKMKLAQHIRKIKTQVTTIELDEDVEAVSLDWLDASLSASALWETIDSELPHFQAAVLRSYYREGLTLQDIATKFTRNVNTVKYHFCQAHVRMAAVLDMAGIKGEDL